MNKLFLSLRLGTAVIIGLLSVFAFFGNFYPVKIFDIQLTALWQKLLVDFSLIAVILLAVLFILTFFFGRIYCSTLCPFGIFQEFLMLFSRRKTTIEKNKPYKYFIAAVFFGMLSGGTVILVRYIDPYSLFGSAMSRAWAGLMAAFLIILLVGFKGRFFCTNICPVGAILGLISKYAFNKIYMDNGLCVSCGLCASKCPTGSIDFKNKTVDNETCIKCFKCLNSCKRSGIHYGSKPSAEIAFSPLRRNLLISSAVVAAFSLAVKGGFERAKNAVAKAKNVILPAGSGRAEDFVNRCLNCNLCVQNCPMKILKKANGDFPTVYVDYADGFCDYNCNKCSSVCPSGAIKRMTLAEKQNTQIGLATIDENKCIKCGLCVMKCPRQIITKKDGDFPLIHTDECIGCGACQNGCPVKAITIIAVDRQKTL